MWITCIYSVDNHVTHIIYRCCPQHMTHGMYVLPPTTCYPHHMSMLSTTYGPRYIQSCRGYMMWITCIHSVDNHVTHIIYRCCPQHVTHGIHVLPPTVCYPHHMSMLSTSCDPRYMQSYRGYMMWITCIYSVDNHVTHIIYRCCPQHMTHGIYALL